METSLNGAAMSTIPKPTRSEKTDGSPNGGASRMPERTQTTATAMTMTLAVHSAEDLGFILRTDVGRLRVSVFGLGFARDIVVFGFA